MSRLSWDEYFVDILKTVAKRSSCLSRKVSALIVKNNRIIATGYNGSPCGIESCEEKGFCMRQGSESGTNLNKCLAVHAEENAILQCARTGISCEGATIFVNCYPCERCMKSIINSGIQEIVYLEEYNDEISHKLAELSNVAVRKYTQTKFTINEAIDYTIKF